MLTGAGRGKQAALRPLALSASILIVMEEASLPNNWRRKLALIVELIFGVGILNYEIITTAFWIPSVSSWIRAVGVTPSVAGEQPQIMRPLFSRSIKTVRIRLENVKIVPIEFPGGGHI